MFIRPIASLIVVWQNKSNCNEVLHMSFPIPGEPTPRGLSPQSEFGARMPDGHGHCAESVAFNNHELIQQQIANPTDQQASEDRGANPYHPLPCTDWIHDPLRGVWYRLGDPSYWRYDPVLGNWRQFVGAIGCSATTQPIATITRNQLPN